MMKLTDTQTQILLAAAARQGRLVKPPAIPPAPRGAIEAKLRGAGLTPLRTVPAWRRWLPPSGRP